MRELSLLEMQDINGGYIAMCKVLRLVTFGSCMASFVFACTLGTVGGILLC